VNTKISGTHYTPIDTNSIEGMPLIFCVRF